MSSMKKSKGYKVADAQRSRICGIACSSLKDLRLKGCLKLNVNKSESLRVQILLQDGTYVEDDEYFQTLPSQTLFIFQKEGETALTGYQILYNALQAVNMDYLKCGQQAAEFFDHATKEKLKDLVKTIHEKQQSKNVCSLSHRKEHPEWFEYLDTRAQTKEEYMSGRARDRIRTYLYKTQDELRKRATDGKQQKIIESILLKFKNQLKKDSHFGHYFDRSADSPIKRICNDDGLFLCEGRWDVGKCLYLESLHGINPYESYEMMVIFSTWNLDHGIERSRSIVPSIFAAVNLAIGAEKKHYVNWSYFYSLLFTRSNIRLVHIVCHDKGSHRSRSCDSNKFLVEDDFSSV